jgi:FdhD protein
VSRPVALSPESAQATWGIAVEAPIEIALNGAPWTVMLATPADVEDLAVGIAVSERVLRDHTRVGTIVVSEYLHDISVNVTVPADALDVSAMRGRSLLGSTACGLCGLESLAALRPRQHADATTSVSVPATDEAILAAFASLPALQSLNNATRSVHAAAWCLPNGDVSIVREDVGRHNALDKLIGALARSGRLGEAGFVVMSSRCSYELVYKAAAAGASTLATISAPTTLALEWSAALGVPVVSCGPGGQLVRFSPEAKHAF